MGRKSVKSKEKKAKRKEEQAKLVTKQILVDDANDNDDPMAQLLPFKRFERNGLALDIHCNRVADLDEETVEWVFQLTKANMQQLYEKSEWGWDDTQKKEEMTELSAWYLVARDQENKPQACVHFRFDVDCDDAVLYCYEIQLEQDVRRKGLGKFLMQILELIANQAKMEKVMLTVFKDNEDAYNFFMKKMKYAVDETSPEETMAEALYEEEICFSYEILSKFTACAKKQQQEAAQMMANNEDVKQAFYGNGHGHSHGAGDCCGHAH